MFTINQAGLPAGTDDLSRTDGLATGAAVTVTYVGSGTFRARLLWVPPGDTGSVASLTESTPGTWTFTPTASKPGSYRIQGIENEGKPNERRAERIFGVRTAAGLLIPAFGEGCNQLAHLENATATHVAQSTNNATDFADADLNDLPWAGWWRMWHELAAAWDGAQGPTGPTGPGYPRVLENLALDGNKTYAAVDPTLSADVIGASHVIVTASASGDMQLLNTGAVVTDMVSFRVLYDVLDWTVTFKNAAGTTLKTIVTSDAILRADFYFDGSAWIYWG
jgi:hypothetical protein